MPILTRVIPAPGSSSGSGNMPAATSVGQVLYSVDGSAFTPEQPLTADTGGWISNDEGLLLVMG